MTESRLHGMAATRPLTIVRWIIDPLRRIDRVLLGTAIILLGLIPVSLDQFRESILFTLGSLLSISPFLAASVAVGAGAKATGADRQVALMLQGRPLATITLAAMFGAVSPFCSCGVVPIVAALLAAGVPLAPVMAFWIASPIMDPEMFILTAAVLGTPFAVGKTLAAIGMGLMAGFATLGLSRRESFASPLLAGASGCSTSCSAKSALRPEPVVWTFWREPGRREQFAAETRSLGFFLLKWLTLAFLIESLMVAWIPGEMVATWLGGDAWWAIPAAVLVGVPAYLNGYAAIPTVSALMDMGMAQGAAMAFMVAGAVTSLPASMAVFAIARRPVFAWYLLMGLGGSLAAGIAWQIAA
jgi:uncharacterized membrane protein YraQ (UPF0718 family)